MGLPGALRADGRHDSARPQRALRSAPRRQHPGRGPSGGGHVVGALDVLMLIMMSKVIVHYDYDYSYCYDDDDDDDDDEE